MRRPLGMALLALLAAPAGAHLVPVPPSACTFDPVTVSSPGAGITATGASPTGTDQLTIRYVLESSTAQFDATGVPARAITGAGVSGTLALPTLFSAAMQKSGDLVTPSLPLTLTVGGGGATLPMALTTGLAAAGGVMREGSPIDAGGHFVLVGVVAGTALPAPFGSDPIVVSLACTATPRPDLDQFAFPPQTKLQSVTVTAKRLRLRAFFAPDASQTADFPGRPALFLAASGAATIGATVQPSLPKSHKLYISRGSDGSLVAVALVRKNPPTYLLGITVPAPALPAAGPADTVLTYQVGGLLARVPVRLKSNRRGTRFHFP